MGVVIDEKSVDFRLILLGLTMNNFKGNKDLLP